MDIRCHAATPWQGDSLPPGPDPRGVWEFRGIAPNRDHLWVLVSKEPNPDPKPPTEEEIERLAFCLREIVPEGVRIPPQPGEWGAVEGKSFYLRHPTSGWRWVSVHEFLAESRKVALRTLLQKKGLLNV